MFFDKFQYIRMIYFFSTIILYSIYNKYTVFL